MRRASEAAKLSGASEKYISLLAQLIKVKISAELGTKSVLTKSI
jgi:hypothetical protein